MNNFKKCLIPSCNAFSDSRGLCINDYRKAKRLVDNKKTTWKILIGKGLATPSKRYDGIGTDNFSKALEMSDKIEAEKKALAANVGIPTPGEDDPPF